MEGNAESMYYAINEKDSSIIGLNHTKSSYLSMDIKDNKLEKLKIWPSPEATMDPLSLLKPDQATLKGFYWLDYLRPLNGQDIFRRNKRKDSDIDAKPRKRFVRE